MSEKKLMSLADMFGESTEESNEKDMIEISKLIPFEKHPFKLYKGERFENMVRSIKDLGVIVPVIVRPKGELYETLSGHNRVNAAKKAGLNKVPVIIRENIDDEEAMLIVTETNLMQRSFLDMLHSERAAALSEHYKALSSQGRRSDLIKEIENMLKASEIKENETSRQVGEKLTSADETGISYQLSGRTVSRYLRIYQLINELKDRLDIEQIPFVAAVELSYLTETEQLLVDDILTVYKFKIDMKKADALREYSQRKNLDEKTAYLILSGEFAKKGNTVKPTGVNLKPKLISKYFFPETKEPKILEGIDKALTLYVETYGKEVLNE